MNHDLLLLGHSLDFTRNLFDTVTNNIAADYDAVIMHASMTRQWPSSQFTGSLIFTAVEDSIEYHDDWKEYDFWNDQEPPLVSLIKKYAQDNPQKTVIFFPQNQHTYHRYFDLPNVRVGKWFTTPNILSHANLDPVEVKNFNSQTTTICLNRQMRSHRLALVSLLHGLELNQHCFISAVRLPTQLDKLPSDNFLDHVSWQFEPGHDTVKDVLCRGFRQVVSGIESYRPDEPYKMESGNETIYTFDNVHNFEQRLKNLYTNSFVEILPNRLFCEPEINIDEKFINCLFGKNFPIMISSSGTVEWYRSLGFDMFEDIIDHSYDSIDNPIDRLYAAVTRNRRAIEDSNYIKTVWQNNMARFDTNIQHYRDNFPRIMKEKTLQECNRCMSEFLVKPF